MKKQIIISIGRETGTGGHEIAQALAHINDIPFYDKNIAKELATVSGFSEEFIHANEEKRRNPLTNRRIRDFDSSFENLVAQAEFQFLKDLADKGESFVIVGRCSNHVLRHNPNLLSIFIYASDDFKVKYIMESDGLTESKAKSHIRRSERKRKAFYESHTDHKWGAREGYDIVIDSSTMGVEKTTKLLKNAIDHFMAE